MNRKFLVIFTSTVCMLLAGSTYSAQAFDGYEKSISIGGTNNVEYNYEEYKSPNVSNEEESFGSNRINIITNYNNWSTPPVNYWHTSRPYHYPSYYSGMPLVFTYSGTGIKTGPDGRGITPLMERELYKHYQRPIAPPIGRPYPPHFHQPPHHHPEHNRPMPSNYHP